jgi:hypothetical protein
MDMEESELPQLFLFLPACARRESSDGFTDMFARPLCGLYPLLRHLQVSL